MTTKSRIILFILFWGSALSGAQTILIREYMCLSGGNEIFLGLVLSLWLLFNSLGALIAGFMKIGDNDRVIYYLSPCSLLLSLASLLFLRYARLILNVDTGVLLDLKVMTISAIISVSLPALLSGLSFPILSNFMKRYNEKLSVSFVYGSESLGLVIGYLLTTSMLSYRIPHLVIMALLFALPALYLFVVKCAFPMAVNLSLAFIVLLILIVSAYHFDRFLLSDSFERTNKGYRFLKAVETNYNRYIVAERGSQKCLFVNNLFSRVIGEEFTSKVMAHLIMSFSDKKEDVLIVGEASYDLLRHINEYKTDVDYVEYDSRLYSMFEGLLSGYNLSNIHFIVDDGRRFIRVCKKRYDIIFIDLPDPLTLQLNRYYTVQFFSEVREILKEDGILVIELPSVASAPSDAKRDFLVSVYNALKENFEHTQIADYEYTLLIASRSPVDIDLERVISRFRRDSIKDCDFEPEVMSLALQSENNQRIKDILESKDKVVNSDLKPEGLFSSLALWEMTASKEGSILMQFKKSPVVYIIVCLLLLLFIASFLMRRKRYIYESTLMFWQGFLSMALELIIIYLFQIVSGTLYYYMALLFSIFMGGLSSGSYLTRHIRLRDSLIVGINILIASILLLNPLNNFLLLLLLFVNGALTGLLFGRLSLRAILKGGASIKKTAAIIDYSDCLGGMFSSLLISVLFIPAVGLKGTLFLLGGISLLSTLFSTISGMDLSIERTD